MTPQPTIRCPHCRLNQFATQNCRRCHKPLSIPAITPEPPNPSTVDTWTVLTQRLATHVKARRLQLGLTQSALALAFGIHARTYFTKIEQGRILPHVAQLEKLAGVLGVPLAWFIEPEPDPFIAELALHAHHLTPAQRDECLGFALIASTNNSLVKPF